MYSFLYFHVTGDIATAFTLELFVKKESNLTRFYEPHYSMQTIIICEEEKQLDKVL
jgi:hypothetical protein